MTIEIELFIISCQLAAIAVLLWDEFKAYVWNHGAELRRREKSRGE